LTAFKLYQTNNNNPDMKYSYNRMLVWLVAVCSLFASMTLSRSQTKVLINAFNTSAEVTPNNGNPWGNWFGSAYYQAVWDSADASNNVNSGSMQLQAFYPDSGLQLGGGPQFVLYNQNNGITPPLAGNGGNPSSALATNIEFDIKFDPISIYNTNNSTWPAIEVGTRGTDFGQHDFNTLSGPFAIGINNTGWVHVSLPIPANAIWATIPNMFFKYYSTSAQGWLKFWVDNIVFTTAPVPIVPPTMAIQKAPHAVRMFAGPSQYDRTQLLAVDTNLSWVGGSYPVTYSFDVTDADINPTINEFHLFWTPVNSVQGGVLNAFTDYSTASNNFRLLMTGGAAGSSAMIAQLDWKTNLVNSNPDHVALRITNATTKGTWKVTFNSATAGTLTAPGASPAPFSIPADVAATFANPLAFFIGIQPDPVPNIGQYIDLAKVQISGVAAPGGAINTDFTTATSIDTNVWTSASVSTAVMRLVPDSSSLWVSSGYPDYGAVVTTTPTLFGAVPWKTAAYYTGYDTNLLNTLLGQRAWHLLPSSAMPTIDGNSNSVKSANAFFRLQSPAPAE